MDADPIPTFAGASPNDLDALWMPFTANRSFKQAPRMLGRAEGMFYWTPDGREVLDATSGLWCVNAGHGRPEIADAIARTARTLDYAPPFQMGHPLMFQAASRLAEVTPPGLDRIFFTNSGSESADTALKIALAYHRARGEAGRIRLIGRERGYHGINFGGLSVGGIGANRRGFGPLLGNVDHLPHTHDPSRNGFSRGLPAHGAEGADALEHLVALHGADTIAAVIVEPMAGSAGVLPPPVGYLKRLRELCDRHGILLIFDEVITGFGRVGAAFAAERWGVVPDLLTMAKGLTNAAVPMGAVAASETIYRTVVENAPPGIELFHGYTYSGHPLACAAAIATLDIHRDENLAARARASERAWEDAVHSLRDRPNVIDIRNVGLVAGIELRPRDGKPTERAARIMQRCFDDGLLIRTTADIIALSPPLVIETAHIDRIVSTLGDAITAEAA
ncbi:aspartate aminotransferase family protein [Rhizosaccharibacter radicis]|uniref:Aspartate aminotransferase family protein n=1 Tax=Rhizosaccharibacter radicis TaxID=2782605 RepID=A0ABT1VX38_9PROT|nr:aspartate aminotransferase family protein [Acetobacteraceae bacterium KSS12]